MKKRYRVTLGIILVIIIMLLIVMFMPKFLKNRENEITRVIDTIDTFGYTLDDRDTDLMKDNYNELKDILDDKEIDIEAYAKSIAKLFIIDLFTINNKLNKYDVGGFEYVWPEARENFKLNVEDTLYKTVEVKNVDERKQELPEVRSIEVSDVTESTFTINDVEYPSFVISLKWDYVKDYGYDKEAEVICVVKENRIYIAKYSTLGE